MWADPRFPVDLPRRYFVSPSLQRLAERRPDADWLQRQLASPAARWLPVVEGRVALRRHADGPELAWLPCLDGDGPVEYTAFLGMVGDMPRFAIGLAPAAADSYAARHDIEFQGLRRVAQLLDAESAGLSAYARALDLWQRGHRYCAGCGRPTTPAHGGFVRHCSHCDREHFPRLDPAVIVAVTFEDRLLLGRQPGWPSGQYSVLAGFVEPGETLESAVRREVAEEAGVRVGPVHYRGSQPWPFPASLMIGFRAQAVSPEIRRGDELEEVRWFDVDSLRSATESGALRLSSAFSISRFLIDEWVHDTTGEDSHRWGTREQARP